MWVLLIIVASVSSDGGVATLRQEFTSRENCETALQQMIAIRGNSRQTLVSYGCFKR